MTDPIVYAARASVKYRKAGEVVPFVDAYVAKKEQEIADIEQLVERYQKRRQAEERAYQSMSTLRRMLSGKKPDHHLALEYIHYVKKPTERVRALRQDIEHARRIQQSASADIVQVSDELAEL
jgi:hypothetical protein